MQKHKEGSTVTVNGQIMVVEEYLPPVPEDGEKGIIGCEAIYYLTDGDGEGDYYRECDID